MTTANQEFQPGDKVLLVHEGVGFYPPAPVTVVEKMVDKHRPCHVCGNLWYGYSGPDYWKNNPSYLLEFKTGARGIFPVRRIKKMDVNGIAVLFRPAEWPYSSGKAGSGKERAGI